jgi:long-chain acyl-CoA synthetase
VCRKDDLIKVEGITIFPKEIEDLVDQHPKIRESAFVGVGTADPFKPLKKLFVVKSDESLEIEEVKEHCKKKLDEGQCPDEVIFVLELPRSVDGSLLRWKLRKYESNL